LANGNLSGITSATVALFDQYDYYNYLHALGQGNDATVFEQFNLRLLEISERLYQSYAKVPSVMDHVRWPLESNK